MNASDEPEKAKPKCYGKYGIFTDCWDCDFAGSCDKLRAESEASEKEPESPEKVKPYAIGFALVPSPYEKVKPKDENKPCMDCKNLPLCEAWEEPCLSCSRIDAADEDHWEASDE